MRPTQTLAQRHAQSVARTHTVLSAIKAHKQAHDGNFPTHRELQVVCGISSTSEVNRALRNLVADGLLERDGVHGFRVPGGRWTYGPPPHLTNGAPHDAAH